MAVKFANLQTMAASVSYRSFLIVRHLEVLYGAYNNVLVPKWVYSGLLAAPFLSAISNILQGMLVRNPKVKRDKCWKGVSRMFKSATQFQYFSVEPSFWFLNWKQNDVLTWRLYLSEGIHHGGQVSQRFFSTLLHINGWKSIYCLLDIWLSSQHELRNNLVCLKMAMSTRRTLTGLTKKDIHLTHLALNEHGCWLDIQKRFQKPG